MTHAEIAEKLVLHELWLNKEVGGVRADFTGAILCGVNFKNANLRRAHFAGADLSYAIFSFANCRNADFRQAILDGALLQGADFSLTDLSFASLYGVQYDGWTSFASAEGVSVLTATWKRHQIVSIDANAAVGCQFASLTDWASRAKLIAEEAGVPYDDYSLRHYVPILKAFYRERIREGIIQKKEKE
jgi:uncharacterized protein YjbI with pentapeptide repeats